MSEPKEKYYIAINENNVIYVKQSSYDEIIADNIIEVSQEIYLSDCMGDKWDFNKKEVVKIIKSTREENKPTEMELLLKQQSLILKKLEELQGVEK